MADTNGAVVDKAVINASVTADETRLAKSTSMWMGSFMRPTPLIALQPSLPDVLNYWDVRTRDAALYSTLDYEDKWANAVSIAATKCASLEYDVEGDVDLRKVRSHDILANVDGMQGWTPFISKHMQDFLTTDNGAFIEIVRASSAVGSRVTGLIHLDSARCVRTGDPERPVVYRDRLGQMHVMRAHQVIALVDMPSPRATFNGSGRCAAHRVYRTIYRMAVIEQYVAEKVDGRKPLTWYLLNGLTQKQVDEALRAANHEADARGLVSYMGASVTSVPTNDDISLVEIPFSSLPDGFDLEAERSNARLEYANAIGLDIQDLQPGAIGGSLGSSTQSEVLNEKSKGKGLAYWRKAFTEQMNLKVLPDATTFLFVEKDYRDDKMQADAESAQMKNVLDAKAAGLLDAKSAVKILIDKDLLPVGTVAPEPLPVPQFDANGKPLPAQAQRQARGASEKPNVIGSGEKPQEAVKSQDEISVAA